MSTHGSVSDSGDGVIETGSAFAGVEDSGPISLENGLVGFDGHGDWSLGDGSLKLGDGFGLDGGIS